MSGACYLKCSCLNRNGVYFTGGESIRQINQLSGAHVEINKATTGNTDFKHFVIRGVLLICLSGNILFLILILHFQSWFLQFPSVVLCVHLEWLCSCASLLVRYFLSFLFCLYTNQIESCSFLGLGRARLMSGSNYTEQSPIKPLKHYEH